MLDHIIIGHQSILVLTKPKQKTKQTKILFHFVHQKLNMFSNIQSWNRQINQATSEHLTQPGHRLADLQFTVMEQAKTDDKTKR